MNSSDFFFKISVVFIQNIKKGYMYMVDCVVIYYYVYVCMDLEGVSVQENVLGILYFGEKNLDLCIICILLEYVFVVFFIIVFV